MPPTNLKKEVKLLFITHKYNSYCRIDKTCFIERAQ
jgi:hypothetical protein